MLPPIGGTVELAKKVCKTKTNAHIESMSRICKHICQCSANHISILECVDKCENDQA